MADVFDKNKRSDIMKRVKSSNTRPEMLIRKYLFSKGYRYRLHKKDIPGKPDLIFPAKKKIIFINGCFWHGHDCKRGARIPKANREYWLKKIGRNVERDKENFSKLKELGYKVAVIWECEMKDFQAIAEKLATFLNE
ncbi:MAG TPA: DNA mismatch endonuclease Vsr [Saprospiraceae bacterium]|nr:DNA mismatch endonuclease Vsr [Lewinellaceae bacterium]HQU59793.1 DNA mismatch endonuclease Vsr [Saprospiraceae bacterium]